MLKKSSLLVFYNNEITRLIRREVIDDFVREILRNSK